MSSGAAGVVLCGGCVVSSALLTFAVVALIRHSRPVSRLVAVCAVFLTARAAASLLLIHAAVSAALTVWAAVLVAALAVHHLRIKKGLISG